MRNLLTVAHITENLPTTINDSYTSPVIFTDGASRFLRFQVMQTLGKRDDSHTFAMSEFQIHEAIIDENESPYYQKDGVKEAFDALLAELQKIRLRISAGSANAEDCNSLRQAIKLAEQALENTTDIIAIDSGRSAMNNAIIYNLAGQRVSKVQKGIYIIGGKKVLK